MQSALATELPTRTGHAKRPKAYSQCLIIQALLQKDIENPDTPASVRAGCVRAWDILEERKRILRGKPLPGHLRPELAHPRKSPKRVALLATMADEPKDSPAGPTNPPPVEKP